MKKTPRERSPVYGIQMVHNHGTKGKRTKYQKNLLSQTVAAYSAKRGWQSKRAGLSNFGQSNYLLGKRSQNLLRLDDE